MICSGTLKKEANTSAKLSPNFSLGGMCPWPLPAKGIDLPVLLSVFGLLLFGLLMVYSSSFIFAQERTGNGFAFINRQIIYAVIGLVGMVMAIRIDYRHWSKTGYWGLGLSILLLTAVLIPGVGVKVGGAQRWIHLGPVSFQPVELVKLAMIIFVAFRLNRKRDRLENFTAGVLGNLLLPLPVLILLLLQPDFGSAVMVTAVIFALMMLAGVRISHLLGTLSVAAAMGVWLVLSAPYRMARFMAFMDPWQDPSGKGFQLVQSLVGFHNGKLFGVGLGNGKEKLFFLPEAHNDFIFSVIGEELGFFGVAFVLLVFAFLVYRGLQIARRSYEQYGDRFGLYLATGITLSIGLQGLVNMAVVLGLVPTKGLSLPFISYGGTALVVDLFAVGILLSVARGPQSGSFKKVSV